MDDDALNDLPQKVKTWWVRKGVAGWMPESNLQQQGLETSRLQWFLVFQAYLPESTHLSVNMSSKLDTPQTAPENFYSLRSFEERLVLVEEWGSCLFHRLSLLPLQRYRSVKSLLQVPLSKLRMLNPEQAEKMIKAASYPLHQYGCERDPQLNACSL